MKRTQRMAWVILCAVCGCESLGGSGGAPKGEASSDEALRSASVVQNAATSSGATTSTSLAAPSRPAPERYFKYRTTDPQIALRNLDGRIEAALRASRAEAPPPSKTAAQLVDWLLLRVSITGSFDDLEAVLDVSRRALEAAPGDAQVVVARARALGAVHRFEPALALLGEHLGRLPSEGRSLVDSLNAARARPAGDWVERSEQAVQKRASFANFSRLGLALATAGRFEEADAAYQKALDAYRSVSPFPVAEVLFQRGVMWAEEANQPERARPLYEAAVRRLPHFVRAQVHLAEIELEAGARRQAVRRLRGIVARTQDPEPAGVLAEALLQKNSEDDTARSLVQKAKQRYSALLEKHPEAFADHAAEFFLGAGGDAAEAYRWAQLNAKLRPTARALSLLANAAFAARGERGVCELTELGSLGSLPTWRLDEGASSALRSCLRPE